MGSERCCLRHSAQCLTVLEKALQFTSYFVPHPTQAAFLSRLDPSLNNFTGVSLAVIAHTCVLVKCIVMCACVFTYAEASKAGCVGFSVFFVFLEVCAMTSLLACVFSTHTSKYVDVFSVVP